jgi:4-amino-4-deoxy-L-arabinose transferase-like glycosyltransferase
MTFLEKLKNIRIALRTSDLDFDKEVLFISLLWAVFFVEVIVVLFFSLNHKIDSDEIASIHASWKIFSGQKIYVDFFEHHHPFFYYTLVPLIEIFKENVFVVIAARGLVFFMLLLIFAVTYNISRNSFGKMSAVISLILLASTKIFIFTAVEIRPDVPQTLFGLLSLSFLFSYFQKRSLKYLISSSISLGVSFLFLQKSVFLAFTIGGLLLFSAYFNQIKLRDILLYLLVFIAILMPYYAYLVINGQLHAYLMYNWTINVDVLQHESSRGIKAILRMTSSYKDNPLLWIFWFLSLFLLDTPNQKRTGVVSLLLLSIFFAVQTPYGQYLMLVMPLIAIMAGYSIYIATNLFIKMRLYVLGVIVIICIFHPLNLYLKVIQASPISKQLKKIEYVLSITRPNDLIYDGGLNFNLFRNDVGLSRFSIGIIKALERFNDKSIYQYNVYGLIEEFKPKVISRYGLGNMKDYRIVNNYRKSDRYPDLFIRIN